MKHVNCSLKIFQNEYFRTSGEINSSRNTQEDISNCWWACNLISSFERSKKQYKIPVVLDTNCSYKNCHFEIQFITLLTHALIVSN